MSVDIGEYFSKGDTLFDMIDSYMHNLICNSHVATNSCNEDLHWCNFLHHHHCCIVDMICDNIDSYKLDSCYIHQWKPNKHSIGCCRRSYPLAGLVLVLLLAWSWVLVEVLVWLLELLLESNHMDIIDLS